MRNFGRMDPEMRLKECFFGRLGAVFGIRCIDIYIKLYTTAESDIKPYLDTMLAA